MTGSSGSYRQIVKDLDLHGFSLETIENVPINPIGQQPLSVPQQEKAVEETDVRRLETRQKQINYGYNTKGYQNYLLKYPRYPNIRFKVLSWRRKSERPPNGPKTPNKRRTCSTRSWAGQISKWRRELHKFDD